MVVQAVHCTIGTPQETAIQPTYHPQAICPEVRLHWPRAVSFPNSHRTTLPSVAALLKANQTFSASPTSPTERPLVTSKVNSLCSEPFGLFHLPLFIYPTSCSVPPPGLLDLTNGLALLNKAPGSPPRLPSTLPLSLCHPPAPQEWHLVGTQPSSRPAPHATRAGSPLLL